MFAAAAIVYASFWMYIERTPGSKVELGFNNHHANEYDGTTQCMKVGDVVPNSPAERAGLRAGDRIIGVNGQPLTTSRPTQKRFRATLLRSPFSARGSRVRSRSTESFANPSRTGRRKALPRPRPCK
jgi:membrane-associated protease RseP (regulator of RpoE activity)